jgi:flagellum-specific ATP synthase
MLDRRLASQGHYPPIAILDSVSRLMPSVCSPQHLAKAQQVRQLLAVHKASEDLLRIGAYQKGSDATLDQAVALMPEINRVLRQAPAETTSLPETLEKLLSLAV